MPPPAKQLVLELFRNEECTEPVQAGDTVVYAYVHRGFGFNEGMTWGSGITPESNAVVFTPDEEFPADPYTISVWISFSSEGFDEPIQSGSVVRLANDSSVVQSGFHTRFYSDLTSDTPVSD